VPRSSHQTVTADRNHRSSNNGQPLAAAARDQTDGDYGARHGEPRIR
jgi:hypothetical protein